ncbi:MAG: hypothetical protein Q9227_008534 [Pyrenula ochraceoflavens]
MPPKKTQHSKVNKGSSENASSEAEGFIKQKKEESESIGAKKRDKPPTKTSQPSAKRQKQEPRQGSRSSTRQSKDPAPSPKQILNFLLSADALQYCYPEDELESSGKTYSKTSPTSFSPFEHLVTASILSKPLSHRLGMRTIRTVFNEPFAFNTADKVADVGEHRVWEAMEAARTQHRQKTASYIFQIGDTVKNGGGEGKWFEGLKKAEGEVKFKEMVKKMKGMGETAADVFSRRVQSNEGWDGVFPFADRKAAEALEEFGVDVPNGEELWATLKEEVTWDKVGDMGLGSNVLKLSTATKQKIALVVVLERALGAKQEGNLDAVLKQSHK